MVRIFCANLKTLTKTGSNLYSAGGEGAVCEANLHARGRQRERVLPRLDGFCMRAVRASNDPTLAVVMQDFCTFCRDFLQKFNKYFSRSLNRYSLNAIALDDFHRIANPSAHVSASHAHDFCAGDGFERRSVSGRRRWDILFRKNNFFF
jgi:hypothetical protein